MSNFSRREFGKIAVAAAGAATVGAQTALANQSAVEGGGAKIAPANTPVRKTPFPKLPQRFDFSESQALVEALQSNDLNYFHKGSFVERLLSAMSSKFGSKYAVATSSGTASLHVAVGGLGIPAGSEIITTAITDVGTAAAILMQNCIPVFADVDPKTSHLTAKTIEAAITEKTRAVIVVHLVGAAVDMEPIVELCRKRKLLLIEDCAQSLGATLKGKSLGTFGDIGCFSLNNQKHITGGEGGFVIMNDEKTYYRCHNFADKYYDRHERGEMMLRLGVNYRMSELQGAVAFAQVPKLPRIAATRRELGLYLTEQIQNIPGVIPMPILANSEPSFFFYQFTLDEAVLKRKRDKFVEQLKAEGIPARGGYIPFPLHRSPMFQKKEFFEGGVWPAELVAKKKYDYTTLKLPGTEQALATTVRLPLHEGYSRADVEDYAAGIRKVAAMI